MVDAKAIADMERIMAALNGTPAPVVEESVAPGASRASAPPAALGDPNIAAMKDILLKLQETSAPTYERLQETARHDPVLAEAMMTDPTPTGARIGSWEIVAHAGNPKRYDVLNVATQEPIAKDLYLYEAAMGLVKKLNEGVTINDPRVRNLLKLEEEYARNRDDAVLFKEQERKLREKGEESRAAVAEDRLDEAQRRANEAQDRILQLAGLRR